MTGILESYTFANTALKANKVHKREQQIPHSRYGSSSFVQHS